MRRNDTTKIGDLGEAEALRLLAERGYTGSNLNDLQRNTWTYDLQIETPRSLIKISVKTARAKRDVSLGRPRSLKRLADDAFLMILMPPTKKQEIRIIPGEYHLLIVPGHVARDEALSMHYDYWGDEITKAEENTVRIKDEVNHPGSRSRAGHVFASWNERFRDAWHLLPEPLPHRQAVETSGRGGSLSERSEPVKAKKDEQGGLSETSKLGIGSKANSDAVNHELAMTPQNIVQSLKYLQRTGLSETQVCQMHHFDKHQSYASLIKYFEGRSKIGSVTNLRFGERLAYVVGEHRAGRCDNFGPLISEACERWRLSG